MVHSIDSNDSPKSFQNLGLYSEYAYIHIRCKNTFTMVHYLVATELHYIFYAFSQNIVEFFFNSSPCETKSSRLKYFIELETASLIQF